MRANTYEEEMANCNPVPPVTNAIDINTSRF